MAWRSIHPDLSSPAFRYDHDPGGANRVAFPISCGVIADHSGRFDEIISANDGAAKAGTSAYDAVVHDDAVFNIDIGLDHYLVSDHRITNISAIDNGSSANNAVSNFTANDPGFRPEIVIRINRPIGIEGIEPRLQSEQIHMSLMIGFKVADIAPIRGFFISFDARYPVGGEIISTDLVRANQSGQYIMAEIFFSPEMSFLQSINKYPGFKQVVTH